MHGLEAHSLMDVSHFLPVKPALHLHQNELTSSTHVPPFIHGLEAHSLMDVSHFLPVKPALQVHQKP